MRVHLSSTLENKTIISAKVTAKIVQYFSLAKFPQFKVIEKLVFHKELRKLICI